MPRGDNKNIDWVAIQSRYLSGELVTNLAKEYGISEKSISNKAYRNAWRKTKEQIKENVAAHVEADLKALCNVTIRVHTAFMLKLETLLPEITNPYLFDGERTNSLFQTAMNNAVKLTTNALKDGDGDTDTEPAGFNVSLDEDA